MQEKPGKISTEKREEEARQISAKKEKAEREAQEKKDAERKAREAHKAKVEAQKTREHKKMQEKQQKGQRKETQDQKDIRLLKESEENKFLSAARAVCDKIAYIRPQRTGGSTLGDVIMPKMTSVNNQTQINTYHMEYRWAMATAPNCMVASLRDPVERFLSEYSMLKDDSGAVEQDEWDFHAKEVPWLSDMKSLKLADSYNEYMSSPANPAFNRQARYLLGFERVQCSERCCGICSHGEPGYPAYA